MTTKHRRPTEAEMRLLEAAAWRRSHNMVICTGRNLRRNVALRCVAKGWLREIQCVRSDDDGFTIEPERWVPGFELTPAGDEILAEVAP